MFCHAVGFPLILHVGFVVSTVILALAAVLAFVFHTLSDTFPPVSVIVAHPFFPLNHLYTIVYVLLAVVHHAVTLSILIFAALNVKSLAAKLVVLTHAHPSAHVNTILHVAFAATCVLLGAHHVQLGFVLSIFSILLLPLYVVFPAASTALKHTYVLLSLSLLNVNVVFDV